MITDKNKDLAQWAMDFALKNGCQAVGTGYPGWGVIQLICYGDLI